MNIKSIYHYLYKENINLQKTIKKHSHEHANQALVIIRYKKKRIVASIYWVAF